MGCEHAVLRAWRLPGFATVDVLVCVDATRARYYYAVAQARAWHGEHAMGVNERWRAS